MAALRRILFGMGLAEEFKWGWPCYARDGRNIVLIHGFKHYCALLFFKGALLADPEGLLVQQTGNVQAARQIRFGGMPDVLRLEPALPAYVQAAIEVEAAGLKVDFKPAEDFDVAEAFSAKLAEAPELKAAFEALTPGRRRAYLLHFSAPKQAKTRAARVEKCTPRILAGKGLDD